MRLSTNEVDFNASPPPIITNLFLATASTSRKMFVFHGFSGPKTTDGRMNETLASGTDLQNSSKSFSHSAFEAP
jgi:hypothetical protein